ncbi:MAG: DUF1428 domain-containing protein [Nanoarchaeota archaeon]|nr:DUF1428 domain-containing protein [Nanoarchaeota archaeon]
MSYIDGFVLTIQEDKIEEYREMAQEAGEVWKKHGALEYFECVGDDMDPDTMGESMIKFPDMANAKPDEIVIFAFIVYESKEHRDDVNKRVMEEMTEKYKDNPDRMKNMPFDMSKMAYGGFNAIVEERK